MGRHERRGMVTRTTRFGHAVQRFGFKIQTRAGTTVDHLVVHALAQAAAEEKLRKTYHHCTIVEMRMIDELARGEGTDLERVISLIVEQEKK
ncbi:MAG: hypothetical protein H7232_16445 [Aeromicrobium sp.]|nr:hypothetical protein [Burkholderiales bacterium]